jgi:type IV secretory pathway VirJ component
MESRRSDRGIKARIFVGLAAGLMALLAVAAILFDHLDRMPYFGGPLYTMFPSAGRPRDGTGIVVLSGDMGLHTGLSPKVAQRLAGAGYPVLGINSLTFAGDRRTPAQVQALIADAARRVLALPGVSRLVLIGHSFGADLLHVGLTGLPQSLRDRVALVILSVPTDTIYLDAGFREYFELGTPDLRPLASAALLDWVPVLCIHGAAEQASLCPKLTRANVRSVTLRGGHNLNRNDAALFATMRVAIAASGERRTERAVPVAAQWGHTPAGFG